MALEHLDSQAPNVSVFMMQTVVKKITLLMVIQVLPWFKTASTVGDNQDQYLSWSTPGENCPACRFYRLYLTNNEGNAMFEFSTNSIGETSKM